LAEAADEFGLRLAYAAVLLQEGELEAGYAQLVHLQGAHAWSPVVQAYAGSALLGMGQVSEAQRVLDEAFARAPADFYVLLKRGELFCRLGVYQPAIDALEAALRGTIDDAVGREAARRLLRFARDKARKGFVRSMSGGLRLPSAWRWPTRWRLRAPRAATSSTQVWGV
jgi:predicted Zn-dependent protease